MTSPIPDPYMDPIAVSHQEQLFSLKEWMVTISNKLDRLETKLDGKADVITVQNMENRIAVIERDLVKGQAESSYLVPQHVRMLEDVGVLKTKAAAISSVETYKKWLWGSAFASFAATIVAVISLLKF